MFAMRRKQPYRAEVTCDKGRGYALLLAVVITSTVLSAATALAGIVLAEIRQTRDVGSAAIAQIRAENTIEEGLFLLRRGGYELLRQWGDRDGRTVENTAPLQPFQIAENDFISFPVNADVSGGQMSITRWVPSADCAEDGGESWIEVAAIAWDPALRGGPFDTVRLPRSYQSDREAPVAILPNTVEIRVRALFCDIDEFNVDIPTRVLIRATADELGVRQTAEVAIPRAAPVSGLFDFVIFSECEIFKGLSAFSPDCPQ